MGNYSVKTDIAELPKQIDSQRLLILVQKLLTGDFSVCNEIIQGHMRLVITVAGRYARSRPALTHDLVSVAFLALTQAVHKFPSVAKDTNITPYIVTTVHSHLSKAVVYDGLIHIPYNRYGEFAKKYFDEQTRSIFTMNPIDPNAFPGEHDFTKLDVDQFLVALKLTRRERLLITYKLENRNNNEIAAKLGVTREIVRKWIYALRVKMLTKMPTDMFQKLMESAGDEYDDYGL